MSKSNLQLALEIALKTKNTKAIDQITKDLVDAGVEVSNLQESSARLSDVFDEIEQKEQLLDQFRKLKSASVETKVAWQEMQAVTTQLSKEYAQTSLESQELEDAVNNQTQALQANKEELKSASIQYKNLQTSQKQISKSLSSAKKGWDKSTTSASKYAKELNTARQQLDKMTAVINEQGTATKRQTSQLEKAQAKVAKLADAHQQATIKGAAYKQTYQQLTAELHTTNVAVQAVADSVDTLTQQTAEQTEQAKAQKLALSESQQSAKRLANEYENSVKQAKRLKTEFDKQNTALNDNRKKLAEAGLSTKGLVQQQKALKVESEKAEQSLVELTDEVENLQRIAKAKVTLGIDADENVRRQINEVSEAYNTLKKSGKLTNAELARATDLHNQKLQALNKTLNHSHQASTNATTSYGNLGKTLSGFAGAYVGIEAVSNGIDELVETSKGLDSLNQKLAYATGSSEEAEKVWGRLKDMANELGLEQLALANGYAQLASATKNLNMSQGETMGVFRGVAEATAAMSLTADEANGVFLALSQIAGKGKVSMEELRGQLGERLTPAMGIAAKAMGVTTAELENMVESGINAKEFLPKFGEALTEAFGEKAQENVNSTTGLINNLANAWSDAKEKILDGGAGDGIKNAIKVLTDGVYEISDAIDNIDPATIELVKDSLSQFADIAQTGFVELMQIIDSVEDGFNAINVAINGTTAEAEKLSLINSLILGINVSLGAFNDGLKTIGIAFDLARGVGAKFFASVAYGLSKITVSDLSDSLKRYAIELDKTASEAFERAETKAQNFESSAVKAMQNYAEATTQSMNELEVSSTQATDQVIQKLEAMADIGGQSAQDIKTAMADTAQSLGIDFEQASTKVSQSMQKSVDSVMELANNFDQLEAEGFDATQLIAQGLQNMQDKAKNKADIEALRQLYSDFGNQGKLSTTQVEAGIDAINQKISKSPDLLDETAKAFEQLGIISKAEADKQAQAQIEAYKKVQESGQASTEQLKKALEGMSSKIEASGDSAVQSWYEAEKATQDFGMSIDDVSSRIDNQTQAIQQVEQADNQATRSQVSNASNLHNVILNVTSATKAKINALQQLGATAEQTKQAYNSIMQSQFFDNQRWASIDHFAQDMNRLNDSIHSQISGFENARNKAIEHTQALSSATVNTHDLTKAKQALRQATDANVQGLIRMDSQTLANLQSAIDSTEAKLKDLDNTAKDVADSIESALERERGNDKRAREIEQNKELLGLEQKLLEAQARGSNEEIKQYQRAIQLQKELNKERNKKAEKQQREQDKTSRNYSNPVPTNSATSNISAKAVADAFEKRIKQAEERGAELFAKRLQDEVKRRPLQ